MECAINPKIKLAITTLFVDVGQVLLTNGWDRGMRRSAAELFKLDYAEMDERHHLTFDTYEEGKLSLDTYLDRVVFYEERAFTREQFKQFMFDQSQPFQEMIDLICGLKARYSLTIAAVSNEGRELTKFRIKKFGLTNFIDFFVSSCYVHIRKPDEDIFRIALDLSEAGPGEVLYIENTAMFIEVAAGLGIKGVLHKDYTTTRAALAGYGLALES
jgi:putative hydrolase of the HAD superfamily